MVTKSKIKYSLSVNGVSAKVQRRIEVGSDTLWKEEGIGEKVAIFK